MPGFWRAASAVMDGGRVDATRAAVKEIPIGEQVRSGGGGIGAAVKKIPIGAATGMQVIIRSGGSDAWCCAAASWRKKACVQRLFNYLLNGCFSYFDRTVEFVITVDTLISSYSRE